MATPTRSIDRKLDALQKRIDAEKAKKPMSERAPTQGLTNWEQTTAEKYVPNPRPKGLTS